MVIHQKRTRQSPKCARPVGRTSRASAESGKDRSVLVPPLWPAWPVLPGPSKATCSQCSKGQPPSSHPSLNLCHHLSSVSSDFKPWCYLGFLLFFDFLVQWVIWGNKIFPPKLPYSLIYLFVFLQISQDLHLPEESDSPVYTYPRKAEIYLESLQS
jgi:hypothetical protein